jgi:hypothetical protein
MQLPFRLPTKATGNAKLAAEVITAGRRSGKKATGGRKATTAGISWGGGQSGPHMNGCVVLPNVTCHSAADSFADRKHVNPILPPAQLGRQYVLMSQSCRDHPTVACRLLRIPIETQVVTLQLLIAIVRPAESELATNILAPRKL